MSKLWEQPGILQTFGELLIEGKSDREIAEELSVRYPIPTTTSAVLGKRSQWQTYEEFEKLFTPEQCTILVTRRRKRIKGGKPAQAGAEDDTPEEPPRHWSLMASTRAIENYETPKLTRTCPNCRERPRERGRNYCLECAKVLCQPTARQEEERRQLEREVRRVYV